MTVTRKVSRTYGQFIPNGSTPLAPTTNNTASAVVGGIGSYSSLRVRTDIELYVLCQGTGSNDIDLTVFHETLIVVGGITSVGGQWTNSPTPLTDASPPIVLGELGDWGQWEYLYPTIDFVNTLTPQIALITWRPKGGTIDTQFRRRSDTIDGIDLWMPWEVQDGSGLINTFTAGVAYSLGARFAQTWFWEYRS